MNETSAFTAATNDDDLLAIMDDVEPTAAAGLGPSELVLVVGIFVVMVGVGASCDRTLLQKMMRSSPKARRAAGIGVACQFLIMPLLAFGLTVVFRVDNDYTALGFLLVGCMPGGNTSNVFSLWGHGVLELSVFMTVVSMLFSFGLTPLCLYVYSQALGLDASVLAFQEIGLAFALLLIPLLLGISLNCCTCTQVHKPRIEQALSLFAFGMFAVIIVLLVRDYADALEGADYRSYVPAVLIFPLSVGIAYAITTLLKLEPAIRRTIVFEVGFQNVAMGFAIGQAMISQPSLRDQTVPFPLIYGTTQFAWAGLLIPLFRWQKRYNESHGRVDMDPHFFVASSDDELPAETEAGKDGAGNGNNKSNALEETFEESVDDDDDADAEQIKMDMEIDDNNAQP